MINVWLVYVGMLLANLVVITGLVAGGLVIVGVVRIDQATTHELLNADPHILWHLPVAHMVLTRELVTLSISLGGLATLSYLVAGLQDTEARMRFRLAATEGLRRVLSAYAIYRAARDAAPDLTGITPK